MNKYNIFYRKIRQDSFIEMSKLRILLNWNNFVKPKKKNDLLYLHKIYNILGKYLLVGLEPNDDFYLRQKILNNEKMYKNDFPSIQLLDDVIQCYLSLNNYLCKKKLIVNDDL